MTDLILSRRRFLLGLAAPAIVHAANIMPVRVFAAELPTVIVPQRSIAVLFSQPIEPNMADIVAAMEKRIHDALFVDFQRLYQDTLVYGEGYIHLDYDRIKRIIDD